MSNKLTLKANKHIINRKKIIKYVKTKKGGSGGSNTYTEEQAKQILENVKTNIQIFIANIKESKKVLDDNIEEITTNPDKYMEDNPYDLPQNAIGKGTMIRRNSGTYDVMSHKQETLRRQRSKGSGDYGFPAGNSYTYENVAGRQSPNGKLYALSGAQNIGNESTNTQEHTYEVPLSPAKNNTRVSGVSTNSNFVFYPPGKKSPTKTKKGPFTRLKEGARKIGQFLTRKKKLPNQSSLNPNQSSTVYRPRGFSIHDLGNSNGYQYIGSNSGNGLSINSQTLEMMGSHPSGWSNQVLPGQVHGQYPDNE